MSPLKSYFQLACAFVLLCLMVVGLAGIAFEALRPDGWLTHVVSGPWTMVALAGAAGALWLTWRWLETRRGHSDLLLYVLAAVGLFFTIKLLV